MENQGLERAIERVLTGYDSRALVRDARVISENYRLRTGTGKRLLTREGEAAAYAAARMPATFAAAQMAIEAAAAAAQMQIRTMLDVGAGTGAVSWAADSVLGLERVTCLEREEAMRAMGMQLMKDTPGALGEAQWQAFDITSPDPLPQADLAAEGYMLGELEESMRIPAARKLFAAAGRMALFIEPGTPQGFANLRAVREALTGEGAYVAAPCPKGAALCPMTGEDWCHFTVRVQRTKLHKLLKGGDAPYEDEKFCFLALTREAPADACGARVLRHPQIEPGRITLTLCEAGEKRIRTVTKKDPLWKRARKIGAGDRI